jgi:hypothetical protein
MRSRLVLPSSGVHVSCPYSRCVLASFGTRRTPEPMRVTSAAMIPCPDRLRRGARSERRTRVFAFDAARGAAQRTGCRTASREARLGRDSEAVPAVRAERAGLGTRPDLLGRAPSRRRRTPRSSDLRKIRCHRLAADHALSARHGRSRSNAILYRHGPPRRTCRTGSGSHGPAAASANPRGQLRRRGFQTREHKRRFGSEFACLGFRSTDGKVLEIGGFACGTPGNPIDRARLACALDRLDLISAGEDRELRAFFTGAPRQLGAACSTPPGEAQKNEPVKTTPGFVVLR